MNPDTTGSQYYGDPVNTKKVKSSDCAPGRFSKRIRSVSFQEIWHSVSVTSDRLGFFSTDYLPTTTRDLSRMTGPRHPVRFMRCRMTVSGLHSSFRSPSNRVCSKELLRTRKKFLSHFSSQFDLILAYDSSFQSTQLLGLRSELWSPTTVLQDLISPSGCLYTSFFLRLIKVGVIVMSGP